MLPFENDRKKRDEFRVRYFFTLYRENLYYIFLI